MPTYEYACQKCGHHFELFQSMTDKPLSTCPKDKYPEKTWAKGRVKRGISGGAGLIFKGSGFYITDYRSEKYKEAAKKDSGSGSSGGESKSGGETKSTGDAKTSSTKPDSKPSKPKPSSTS